MQGQLDSELTARGREQTETNAGVLAAAEHFVAGDGPFPGFVPRA